MAGPLGVILRQRPCSFCGAVCRLPPSQPCDLPSAARPAETKCRQSRRKTMTAEPILTSDIIGLTRTAPLSRRGFMTASAATAAGYTLAAGPVRADVVTTDSNGLIAGDA